MDPRRTKTSPAPRLLRALLALALLAASSPALGLAPDHRWRTLETPHFVLHFHEGLYSLASRSARSLERAHERLVPLLGVEPARKTQVVLSDDTDSANGSATAFERPRIWLLAAPPDTSSELGDYDDWVFLLVAHEYVHVLQLGAASAPYSWLNWIFGDIFQPNGLHPRFFTEGLAVYYESLLGDGGRVRSALFDMYLRTDVLGGRPLGLSQLSGGTLRWPRGSAAYLYGGRILAYLAETRGDEALRAYVREVAGHPVPYRMDRGLQEAAGLDFEALWDEWVASMRERYAAQEAIVRSRGEVTTPSISTARGDRTGSPRWSNDGRLLLYVEDTAHRRPRLRSIDPATGEDRTISDLGSGGAFAPLPDGRALVARPEVLGYHRIVGDLFVVGGSGEERITEGLRASEPDVSPDGRFACFVTRAFGETAIELISLEDPAAPPVVVHRPRGGRVVGTPRISPDGGSILFSQSRLGPGKDLLVVPSGGGEPVQLTDDDASDQDPAWLPDGSAIVFSSDRDGIFNLYAVPAGGGELARLTNVLTGAFQPDVSPDGSWLAWTTYGPDGFDVAAAPMERLRHTPAERFVSDRRPPRSLTAGERFADDHRSPDGPATESRFASDDTQSPAQVERFAIGDGSTQSQAQVERFAIADGSPQSPAQEERFAGDDQAPGDVGVGPGTPDETESVANHYANGATYPVRRYDPLETLGPQSWFPYLGADREGAVLGAMMTGADAVGLHAWTLSAGAGIESRQPEGSATWAYHGWRLEPALSAATAYRSTPGFPLGTTERVTFGSAGLSLPFASTRRSQSVTLAYQATWYEPLHAGRAGFEPGRGVATELQARWQYADAERPAESVSPENGIGLGLLGRKGSRALGGDFEYESVSGSAATWVRLPWSRHHVLAASAVGGIGRGDQGERRLFALGGPQLRNPVLDLLLTGPVLGGGLLRGYAPGAFVGSAFALGSLEYRFPLVWIDRGPSVLPLYAGKLAGAIFADAGDAFDPVSPPKFHPSVGAELRLGVSLGWYLSGSIVLGHAYGFDVAEGGGHRPYLGVGAAF